MDWEMRIRKTTLLLVALIVISILLVCSYCWTWSLPDTINSVKASTDELVKSEGTKSDTSLPPTIKPLIKPTQERETSSLDYNKTRCNFYNSSSATINYNHLVGLLNTIIPPLQHRSKLEDYPSYCWRGLTVIKSILISELRQQYSAPKLPSETINDRGIRGVVCPPSVFMAGFPMSGSDYVYKMLITHPQVRGGLVTQPHFWTGFPFTNSDRLDDIAIRTYLSNFNSGYMCPNCVTIDASQSLLWNTKNAVSDCAIPKLIKTVIPNAKFIVLLRDPVERTYSEFFTFGMKGCEKHFPPRMVGPHLFNAKVSAEVERFKKCLESHDEDYCAHMTLVTSPPVYRNCGSLKLSSSIYSIHIKRWFQFFPKKNFLFLHLKEVMSDLFTTMQKIWLFIGVEPLSKEDFYNKIALVSPLKVSHAKDMKDSTREILESFFSPYNQKLTELLNDGKFLFTDHDY